MTYEKAIGWMMVKKQCIIECPDEPNDASKEIIEAYNVAIEALEKQIPKKPKIIKVPNTSFTKSCSRYVCPTCGNSLFSGCRCDNNDCGQAIDWED